MMLDIISVSINAFILSYCISTTLIPDKKKPYTLVCGPLCIIEMFMFSNPSFLSNLFLIILLCITHAFILYLYKYKAIIYGISTALLFLSALLCVNYLSVRLLTYAGDNYGFILSFIYAVICFVLLKILQHNKESLILLEKNKTFGLIGIILFVLLSLLMQALTFIKLTESTIIVLILLLCILSLLFIYLFFQYKQNYLEKEKLKIQRENNDKINHMYDSLLKKEHRMIYVLRKLDHSITDSDTHQFIEEEIDHMMHKQFVSHTNNPMFDQRLTLLIQSLEDHDIKMMEMIPEDMRLDELNVIEEMEIFIREHIEDHLEIRLKVENDNLIVRCNDKVETIQLKTPH